MKKMRKLIPALAMLLVSAVMMSTASFAWFSMNTEASATGMQIKASSTGGLAIGAWTGTAGAFKTDGVTPDAIAPVDTAFANSVAYGWVNNDTAKIQPTSHSFKNGSKWAKAEAENISSSAAKTGTYAAADVKGYYIWTKWDVKSLSEDGNVDVALTGITISGVTAEAAQTNLSKAIRVAIYHSVENKWYYFAPNYDAGTALQYTLWDGTTTFTKTTYGTVEGGETIVCGTPNTIVANDVTQAAETLDVYIYFEGEDANCMSANAVSADTITVSLTFNAA